VRCPKTTDTRLHSDSFFADQRTFPRFFDSISRAIRSWISNKMISVGLDLFPSRRTRPLRLESPSLNMNCWLLFSLVIFPRPLSPLCGTRGIVRLSKRRHGTTHRLVVCAPGDNCFGFFPPQHPDARSSRGPFCARPMLRRIYGKLAVFSDHGGSVGGHFSFLQPDRPRRRVLSGPGFCSDRPPLYICP